MFWAIIVILIIAADQVSKFFITKNVDLGELIEIIRNFFYITYIRNKGAAWSIFQNGRYFFIVMTIIASILIIYFLLKSKNKILSLSLSFILGGAIGNLIDRIAAGSVVDFLEFHFWSYRFPVFNVADIFITTGTILLAYYLIFIYKEPAKATEMEGRSE
ncbi:MAG TPA: signal peptidase II [Clostridiaceae bacterium]|nr:signal peptidase II [Clostridiaceae bacterium]